MRVYYFPDGLRDSVVRMGCATTQTRCSEGFQCLLVDPVYAVEAGLTSIRKTLVVATGRSQRLFLRAAGPWTGSLPVSLTLSLTSISQLPSSHLFFHLIDPARPLNAPLVLEAGGTVHAIAGKKGHPPTARVAVSVKPLRPPPPPEIRVARGTTPK